MSDLNSHSRKDFLTKIYLYCGIFSSLTYVAMNIFIPMWYEGYNSAYHTVSELSAVGAPTRELWVWIANLYSLTATLFALGVMQSSKDNRKLRTCGIFLLLYGIVSFLWPFAPMHQREVLAGGGATFSDTMHLTLAMISVILMTLALVFGAAALGKQFRLYSIITLISLLIFGSLTAMDAPKVEANLPTPMAGVWERINIGVFLVWVMVLTLSLLKMKSLQGRS